MIPAETIPAAPVATSFQDFVPKLLASYQKFGGLNNSDALNLPSKRAVGEICEDLLQLLFPGFHDNDVVHNGTEIRTNAGARTVFSGAQSGAGEIGGADEGVGAIDDDGFGVNARAKNSLKKMTVNQMRVAIKVGPKARAGFFGVHQPDVDSLFDQVRKNF